MEPQTRKNALVGKTAYALLFVVVIPVLLFWWARATAPVVHLPVVQGDWEGWLISIIGFILLLSGMWTIIRWGDGLPMNAYPPSTFVTRGPYRILRNPIYVGFVMVCVGISVVLGSASGLWLVSPLVALGLAALVLGFERKDVSDRFEEAATFRPLLTLPPDTDVRPNLADRISTFFYAFVPWSIAFEAVYRLGVPPDAIEAYLPFERSLPVLEWTEIFYASVYLFVGLIPFFLNSRSELRRFAVLGLVATALVIPIYLLVPVIAPPRPFEPQSFLGTMLTYERWMSHTVGAFPSFHVIWVLIAAETWSRYSRSLTLPAWVWASLIIISCVTTGMHAIADLAVAVVLFFPIRSYRSVWEFLRSTSERIANSWREWRFGPVRVLNYGVYAALGGGLGLLIAMTLTGPDQFWGAVIVGFFALFGAGLWAQKLEGSSGLSRPFGFYGGLFGATIGILIVGFMGYNVYLLFGGFALCGPVAQGIGRFRCLVQGCCHGRPTADHIGIRYHIPKSRVLEKANLGGVPLHPTPLYSMMTNALIFVTLLRLWTLETSLGLIIGLYFILNGLARFVEESLRGEPQTPIVVGLRLYQWTALISIVIGVTFTVLPTGPAAMPLVVPSPVMIGTALLFGLICGIFMGVDFPTSNRRYARLASP